jgi:repressor LexA
LKEQMFARRGIKVKGLSARQEQILEFIRRFGREQGFPPAIRDIVAGCRISSTSVVAYNLDVLEEQGYLKRHRDVSRGIELSGRDNQERQFQVPLIGIIAAGAPIPVPMPDSWNVTPSSDTVPVLEDLILGRRDVYALKVKGTSMIDALINDGDIILLEHTNTVENGETAAVWLKQEKETTLKKVYRENGLIRLQPANSTMQPIYTPADNIEIQGRLIAVIRKVA